MQQAGWFHLLDAWRDFYIFAGGAAATLLGLMFVVVSLARRALNTDEGRGAVRGFFTPIVAFFATEIVITMLILVPYETPVTLGALLAALGASGLAYMTASGVHQRWRAGRLDLDDWIWYFIAPSVSYAAIVAAAIGFWIGTAFGLYVMAVVMGVLLIVGIRNAWDLVVFTLQRDANAQTP